MIVTAAVYHNGKIYRGKSCSEALLNVPRKELNGEFIKAFSDGTAHCFINDRGERLNRKEAYWEAVRSGQIKNVYADKVLQSWMLDFTKLSEDIDK
jgi:hypothetical protein